MNIKDCLLNDIQPLQLDDKIADARRVFSELRYSHLPVCRGKELVGCLAESDAYCLDDDLKLDELDFSLDNFYVHQTDDWLGILQRFHREDTTLLPVLDQQGNYMGYYELQDVVHILYDTPFINEPGALIEVVKGSTDYSFSELSQIVESNQSRVLGMIVSEASNDKVQVTLKITPQNLNDVLATLRRYSYEVVTTVDEDSYLKSIKERSEYLSKYLDV